MSVSWRALAKTPETDAAARILSRVGIFLPAFAARDAAAPSARQSPPHASHAASHAATLTMSIVTESRRHLARWATRAAVRPMAIIPDSHQVKEKKDAERVDFFGDQQAIDSRCVRTRRVAVHPERCRERFRDDAREGRPRGPGANRPHLPAPSTPCDESNEIRPANDQNSPASLTHRAPFPRKNVRPKTANPPCRYALLDKVRQKAIAFEERYRKNGKGFVRPWEVNPELKSVIDPVAHVADDEKK